MDGVDPSSLLQVTVLYTRNGVRGNEYPIVAFAGVVDARSRTVRIVTSSEDNGVYAEVAKVLIQGSSIEGTPAGFQTATSCGPRGCRWPAMRVGVEIGCTGEAELWGDL